jgi:hypothetical protein
VEQTREPMDKNWIRGLRCRASEPMIAKPTSIKGTGGKSSGCAAGGPIETFILFIFENCYAASITPAELIVKIATKYSQSTQFAKVLLVPLCFATYFKLKG